MKYTTKRREKIKAELHKWLPLLSLFTIVFLVLTLAGCEKPTPHCIEIPAGEETLTKCEVEP